MVFEIDLAFVRAVLVVHCQTLEQPERDTVIALNVVHASQKSVPLRHGLGHIVAQAARALALAVDRCEVEEDVT